MINERIALVMLEGEIPANSDPDPYYTKRLYHATQNFADASLHLCEVGKTRKFEEYLKVALKLFKEGNETVKNAIINVYLFTISHAVDKQAQLIQYVQCVFPKEINDSVSQTSLFQRCMMEVMLWHKQHHTY